MSEGEGGDAGLERELRRLLRDRESGPAPLGLRQRVDRIPETEAQPRRGRLVARVAPVLAVAAVLVLAVLAGQALRLGQTAPPAASPGPSPAPTFDPNLAGPGVAPAADTAPLWALVLIAGAVLLLLGLYLPGRRRIIPVVTAGLVLAWALLGSFLPLSVGVYFTGPGTGVVTAEMPPAVGLQQFYVVAPAGRPYSVGVGIIGADPVPVPVRVEGIVGAYPPGWVASRWTAVWLDGAPNGGSSGPSQPFTPFDLGGPGQGLWMVGRAGPCAVGPSFDQHASTAGSYESPALTLRLSVLGWPRTIELPEPVIVEPDGQSCPPGAASPSASPFPLQTASPSG